MPIDYEKLLNRRFPVIEKTYDERDSIYYALGLGLGLDPTDQDQLRFVYEQHKGGLEALPTMAVILAYAGHWSRQPDTGLDWKRIVHAEQFLTVHRPIAPAGTVYAQTRITNIVDKGADKGAIIYNERDIRDKETNTLIATVTMSTFARGDGGFGGSRALPREPHVLPERKPDAVVDFATSPQAGLIYRLSADLNPLHADPEVAAQAGYPRPILHGLCTYGVVGHRLLAIACGGDPTRLRSLSARFSAPVYPGETIRTEAWIDGEVVSFRALVPERGLVVLSNGRADIARA